MSINLMPWRAQRRKQLQKDFLTRLGAAALGALGVVVIGAMVVSGNISGQMSRNSFLDKAIDQAEDDIKEIKVLEERKTQMLARKEVIDRLQANRDQLAHIFQELANNSIRGIVLTGMTHKGTNLEIEGLSESNSVVASFLKKLEASPWFDKPEIVIISVDDGSKTGKMATPTSPLGYTFTIRTSLKNPNVASAPVDTDVAAKPKAGQRERLRERAKPAKPAAE